MRRILLTFLVLGGCTCDSDDTPPGTDPSPPACLGIAVPSCFDDCCFEITSADVDPVTCDATCPGDLRPLFAFEECSWTGRCIHDGGMPPACVLDAGPPPVCLAGECCEGMDMAIFDPVTCSYSCPPGTDFTCAPAETCGEDLRSCGETSECEVVSQTCCGECGEATLEGSTAIRADRVEDHFEGLCADDIACDPCVGGPNPDLVATCNAARCVAVDLSRLPLAACTTDDECRLRAPECCECGSDVSPEALVAIRADAEADLRSLLCDRTAVCGACAPAYPPSVAAACVGGRCAVVPSPSGG